MFLAIDIDHRDLCLLIPCGNLNPAGLAAGVYSGLTYGLREARGSHDWVSPSIPFFFPSSHDYWITLSIANVEDGDLEIKISVAEHP